MRSFFQLFQLIFALMLGIALSQSAYADRSKKALKEFLEGDYAGAIESLAKSVEKDSINTSAYYVYALIFSNPEFPDYKVDSAHYFILRSLKDHERSDEKQLKELEKLERDLSDIEKLKSQIDQLAFEEAKEKNSIRAYEYFMARYIEAEQFSEAEKRRNTLVFSIVEQNDTWQAYEAFFLKYPDALEAPRARERYELLLFEDRTSGNTLNSFTQFLVDFPMTPYRNDAERRILEIMAADNSPRSYTKFMDSYPKSVWYREAINRLYQISSVRGATDYSTYFKNYSDSLRSSSKLDSIPLLTIYDDGVYGFINYHGEEVYPPQYDNVDPDYLCGEISSDYLIVLTNDQNNIVNRTGATLYSGKFDSVKDLGGGYLLIDDQGTLIVLHKSGTKILEGEYDEIVFPNHQYFVLYENDQAGLATVFGEKVIPAKYDDIFTEGDFWVFEKRDLFAIATVDQLAQTANQQLFEPDFRYDDVELLRDEYLFVANNEYEAVIDTTLKEVVPWRVHQISPMPGGWILRQPFGYRILQDHDRQEDVQLYDDVRYSNSWISIKKDEKWSVFPQTSTGQPYTDLDTMNLIGEMAVFAGQKGKNALLFSNGQSIDLEPDQVVSVIKSAETVTRTEYYLVKNRLACVVYNSEGKRLFLERIDNVSYLAPGFFEISWRGKKGIIKENGLVVIKAEHDAIGLVSDEIALILDNSRFGYYHLDSRKTISPKYSQRLAEYNSNYLVASQNNKKGIINARDGTEVTGFWYEDVRYWTDSTALVRLEEEYQVINIETGESTLSEIRRVQPLLESEDEVVLSILGKDGFGILSNKIGEVLPPEYNDIVNLGTQENPIYFAEQHLPRAEFYVVTYSDRYGKVIRSQAFRSSEYDKIYCEE